MLRNEEKIMSNFCGFQLYVEGEKKAIDRFITFFQEGGEKFFYRVGQDCLIERTGDNGATISGECPNSIIDCFTYHIEDSKANDGRVVTNLEIETRELGLYVSVRGICSDQFLQALIVENGETQEEWEKLYPYEKFCGNSEEEYEELEEAWADFEVQFLNEA